MLPTTDLPSTLSAELLAAESIVWTGRPPQGLIRREHLLSIPIGLALLVFAWLMVIEFRPPLTGRRESDSLISLDLLIVGAYVAFIDPVRDWRRRHRTLYILTDRRAMISGGRRFLAMYFLNAKLETELIRHVAGLTSIRFGTPAAASWLGAENRKQKRTAARETQLFSRLPDGQTLLVQIHRICAAGSHDPPAPGDIPFVRRLDPETQHDTGASALTDPLDYAQPIRAKLLSGEQTVYVARPPTGFVFRTQDWVYTPFAAIWTLFALHFVRRSWRFGCPAVIGLSFVAVGFYMLIGRFFHDRRERRRTWYAVSNRRCLIVRDGKIIETKSLYWGFIQGIVRRTHEDGTATLFFQLSALGREDTAPETDMTSMRHEEGICFERIDDPKPVEDLIFHRAMYEGTDPA